MRAGLKAAVLGIVTAAVLVLPAGAAATQVGLGAETAAPGRCFADQQNAYASTSCQVFYGAQLEILALASRDDGSVRLAPQPFTLLALGTGGGSTPVAAFTLFDGNEADDRPLIVPPRSTDYQLRFEGNEVIGPATSATMVVGVGARITIPPDPSSGAGTGLGLPVRVVVPDRALRGRIELRRCNRVKAQSAASCARRSSYTVLATRSASQTRQVRFRISAPARTMRRYEVAFRPESKRFATTRQAFDVTNGYDGLVSYRPTVRRSPFGNR